MAEFSSYIMGTPGDDEIVPGYASPETTGGLPGAGDDAFIGSWGYDTLDGGPGADVLDGGAGTDMLVFEGEVAAGVLVDLGSGAARDAWGFWDRLNGIEDATGTRFGDTLIGGLGRNRLVGGEGDDRLDGNGGGDRLEGGRGDDAYVVRDVGDVLVEDAGEGVDRAEVLVSGFRLADGASVEELRLLLRGSLFGNASSNAIFADGGAATLDGGAGDDVLQGSVAADVLFGGAGDDVLRGGGGADLLAGGPGDDRYEIDDAAARVEEAAGEGADTAWISVDDWAAPLNLEVLRLEGGATRLSGTDAGGVLMANPLLGSVVAGGGGGDTVWGGWRDDVLRGGGGNDILLGVAGADLLDGGAGDDLYVLQDIAARVVEQPGGGRDTAWILGEGAWALPEGVEVAYLGGAARRLLGSSDGNIILGNPALANVIDGGAGDDQLYGGAASDLLIGGDGDDAFMGLGGGDRLVGGAGNDLYVIGHLGDVAIEEAGGGTDAALAMVPAWDVSPGIEVAYSMGDGVALRAGAGGQILVGNAARGALLDGGPGDDTIWGTVHADVLIGGAGNDIMVCGGGADRLEFGESGWGHDSILGLGADAVLDFRGSGLAGRDELVLSDLGGVIRLDSAAGVVDFYAAPLDAIQRLEMIF
jgi:Ca2+-binding RTX toxin-like protein